VNYFQATFFKVHGIKFSRGVKKRDATASALLALFLRMGWSLQFANLSIPFQKTTWNTRVQQRTALLKVLNMSCRISSQPAVFPVFSAFIHMKTVAAVTAFSSPKFTSCISNGMRVTDVKRCFKRFYSLHQARRYLHCWAKHHFGSWWI